MRTGRMWVAVGLALLGMGCVSSRPQWRSVTSPDGKFTVSMPAEPQRVDTVDESGKDMFGKIPETILKASTSSLTCQVLWYDVPDGFNFVPGNLWDRLLDGQKIVSQKPISMAGNPGREVVAVNKGATVHMRMYMVDRRAYYLVTASEPDGSPDLGTFLDSFKLN